MRRRSSSATTSDDDVAEAAVVVAAVLLVVLVVAATLGYGFTQSSLLRSGSLSIYAESVSDGGLLVKQVPPVVALAFAGERTGGSGRIEVLRMTFALASDVDALDFGNAVVRHDGNRAAPEGHPSIVLVWSDPLAGAVLRSGESVNVHVPVPEPLPPRSPFAFKILLSGGESIVVDGRTPSVYPKGGDEVEFELGEPTAGAIRR